jgi:hypothetical protein
MPGQPQAPGCARLHHHPHRHRPHQARGHRHDPRGLARRRRTLTLRTPNGSIVGGLLISQDVADDGSIFNGIYGANSGNTGWMSAWASTPTCASSTPRASGSRMSRHRHAPHLRAMVAFNEDSGAAVQIVIEGGDGTATGTIKVLPVSGSLGVAVGRIEVNLGAGLLCTSAAPAPTRPTT